MVLPALPTIQDPVLLERVFTDGSFLNHPAKGGPENNNRTLAILGDAVLKAILVKRILALHPSISPRSLQLMIDPLLSNRTLARLADDLGLTDRVRVWAHRSAPVIGTSIAQATVFEAYVGALHTLDPGSQSLGDFLADLYDSHIQQELAGSVESLRGYSSRASRRARTSKTHIASVSSEILVPSEPVRAAAASHTPPIQKVREERNTIVTTPAREPEELLTGESVKVGAGISTSAFPSPMALETPVVRTSSDETIAAKVRAPPGLTGRRDWRGMIAQYHACHKAPEAGVSLKYAVHQVSTEAKNDGFRASLSLGSRIIGLGWSRNAIGASHWAARDAWNKRESIWT